MATWIEAGSLTGATVSGGVSALRDVAGVFQTAGAVNAPITTRLQVNISSTADRMIAKVKFRYNDGEWNGWNDDIAFPARWAPWAAMFVTPDSALSYPSNGKPTIQQIISSSQALVYRGTKTSASGINPFDLHFTINGPRPSALSPGAKYWVAVMPTYSRVGTSPPNNGLGTNHGTPSYNNDKVVVPGAQESMGRAVAFWTNRSPGKPTITSPSHRSIVNPGDTFQLKANFPDPDSLGSGSIAERGIIGVHVQYARQPLSPEDNPTWQDIPFGVFGRIDPGWVILGSNYKEPGQSSAPYGPLTMINGTSAANSYSVIRAGVSPSGSVEPMGFLPPGDWQIRVRSFDQGNPGTYGSVRPQDGVARNYVPAGVPNTGGVAYPSFNTSAWSDPVYVTIPVRVPPPIPVSPIDGVALQDNKTVTLRWRYRNTAPTSNTQKYQRVEMRKVGDPDWTVVSSQTSGNHYASFDPDEPSDPIGYIQSTVTDFGFEAGTTDLFDSFGYPAGVTLTKSIEVDAVTPAPPQGSKVLRLTQTGTTPSSGTFGLQTPLLPIKPNVGRLAFRGLIYIPSGGSNISCRIQVFNAAGVQIHQTAVTAITTTANTWNWINYGANLTSYPSVQTDARFMRVQIIGATTGTLNNVRLDAVTIDAEPFPLPVETSFSYPFVSGNEYEWRVLVSDASNAFSFYSQPARFWVVASPASGGNRPLPSQTIDGATLGCGRHRAFIYRRGGKTRVGEITGISTLDWNRVRDDISTAKVEVRDWSPDCGNLLSKLQTWAYELVLFRDNGYTVDRVWEGPITLLTYERDRVTIHAKDVMAIAYRRIMKQRLSDAGTGSTVVDRAVRVLQNAFAPDDPNVLGYLAPLDDTNDSAKQYRNTPAYSRTAFEEVDDMAANAGLDYTVIGRSILLWGTRQRIGTLPEFRDEDLGSPPIVSEYGMSMANRYAVSDGNGVFGEADRLNSEGTDPVYGIIEMLSSTWASDSSTDSGAYTEEGLETVRQSFVEFSERGIADKYPPPVVVRIPQNTTLNPDAVVSIQHLVPGVVIPLRSTGTLRTVVADQKLDSVTVTEEAGRETINITVSPFSRDDAAMDTEVVE